MGQITIDEMHNSLFDYAQAVSDENLITESKTIVGAINETYGKKLIANAIGEPLNSTDTYAKMNNDINELLTTFKTNMMNSGVTVESGDKFKALIDKIKGLTEDEGNKGVQYVEGTIESAESSTYVFTTVDGNLKSKNYAIIPKLPFEPIILILDVYDNISGRTWISILSYDSSLSMNTVKVGSFSENSETVSSYHFKADDDVLTNDYIRMPIWGNKNELTFKYCAIGVGEGEEEDTTLSGGLDIISATTLPATGKENQICVITSNPVNNFIMTGNSAESNNDKIVIYNSTGNSNYNAVKNNITYSYNISRVRYQSNNLSSYYWGNNQWNQLTVGSAILFENGEFLSTDLTGGFGLANGTNISGSDFAFVGGREYSLVSTTTKKINFSNFKTLKIKLRSDTTATFVVGSFKSTYSGKNGSSFSTTGKTYNEYSIQPSMSVKEISIDVSGWTTGYLGFFRSAQSVAPSIYITKITLE